MCKTFSTGQGGSLVHDFEFLNTYQGRTISVRSMVEREVPLLKCDNFNGRNRNSYLTVTALNDSKTIFCTRLSFCPNNSAPLVTIDDKDLKESYKYPTEGWSYDEFSLGTPMILESAFDRRGLDLPIEDAFHSPIDHVNLKVLRQFYAGSGWTKSVGQKVNRLIWEHFYTAPNMWVVDEVDYTLGKGIMVPKWEDIDVPIVELSNDIPYVAPVIVPKNTMADKPKMCSCGDPQCPFPTSQGAAQPPPDWDFDDTDEEEEEED